ncbi:helix-turn-helix domain-containing protein [Nonomuraea sp. CA-143628]|uniref:helix-turn-helix domain-containing protein n=1 Tax=Nonomuraea sp. CA-143628 TaxID=3239997 RepID=UPI003D929DE8
MRAALGRWHMGRVIAAYRTHQHHGRPLRQETVAAWVGITQPQLSRIENGPAMVDLGKLTQWARLLDIPTELLWFQVPEQRAPCPARHVPIPAPAVVVEVPPGEGPAGDDTATMRGWRVMDAQIGGAYLYGTVTAYLRDQVGPRLFGGAGGADGVAVFTSAAALTEMAGWMAHEAGRDEDARRHFHRAWDLSTIGRDRHLGVHVLNSVAHLAHHQARPDEAISVAQAAARALATGPHNPELQAKLLATQARCHATLGQAREARALLHDAEAALQGTHDEAPSPWVSSFDQGALACDAARCMRQLGDLPAAQRHAERVLELRSAGRIRSRAFGNLTLASALIGQGELERACAVATDVIHSTQALGSYLVIQQFRELRALLKPHTAPIARAVVESLAEALRQRVWWYQWLTDSNPRPDTPKACHHDRS